jgi:hypothetical protein
VEGIYRKGAPPCFALLLAMNRLLEAFVSKWVAHLPQSCTSPKRMALRARLFLEDASGAECESRRAFGYCRTDRYTLACTKSDAHEKCHKFAYSAGLSLGGAFAAAALAPHSRSYARISSRIDSSEGKGIGGTVAGYSLSG